MLHMLFTMWVIEFSEREINSKEYITSRKYKREIRQYSTNVVWWLLTIVSAH